jgi:hypothetical protein
MVVQSSTAELYIISHLICQHDWSAAGLAMSDDAKLQAIADGIHQAYNVGLEDVCQMHVFSNSLNTLCLSLDVSHYLGHTHPSPFARRWCHGSNTI